MVRVPWDSDLRTIALARLSSNYKLQIRPLVREDAPQEGNCNCQENFHERERKIWSLTPDGGLMPGQTGRLAIGSNITLISCVEKSWCETAASHGF
jgi:hypothetical protein